MMSNNTVSQNSQSIPKTTKAEELKALSKCVDPPGLANFHQTGFCLL
jgi:hypothetical protein